MRHRDDQDTVLLRLINRAILEPAQAAAPNLFTQRMPATRKLPNPLNCCNRLQQKCVAQARNSSVVLRNRFIKLALSDFKNADVHFDRYLASTSSSGNALISPLR